MLTLTNLTTHPMDLDRFSADTEPIGDFLTSHGLDGFEIMLLDEWEEHRLSDKMIQGVHMRFWPIWLDYWQGNQESLLKEFHTEEAVKAFYGGASRQAMIDHYRKELARAREKQASYAVFHVSHVALEECYTYKFEYTDETVAEAFIELINAITEGIDLNEESNAPITLLFENQWWPGLTFKNPALMDQIMKGVKYPHKGFMLDIGHLMNTQVQLGTESEAVDYIMDCLDDLEHRTHWIKGIHLNSSLSGAYVMKRALAEDLDYNPMKPFMERYIDAYKHIGQIDHHETFKDPNISKIIQRIQPDYLVYEFITETYEQLSEKIKEQHRVLNK